MQFRKEGDQYFIRFDPNENVLELLTQLISVEEIKSGFFTAVGALKFAKLRYFDQNSHDFLEKTFEEGMEITSFSGNITVMSGNPYIHPHIVLGRSDFSTISGHLAEGIVGPTVEMVLIRTKVFVDRIADSGIGLNIFKFS